MASKKSRVSGEPRSFFLTYDLIAEISRIAEVEDRPLSNVVRRLLRRGLASIEAEQGTGGAGEVG